MRSDELARFLTKRGYKVDKVVEQGGKLLVYLEDGIDEAVKLFTTVEDRTSIFFAQAEPKVLPIWKQIYKKVLNAAKQPFNSRNTG